VTDLSRYEVTLDSEASEKLRALEQELGVSLVPVRALARLPSPALERVTTLERELDVVLLAFD
jgi:hypothetical protein